MVSCRSYHVRSRLVLDLPGRTCGGSLPRACSVADCGLLEVVKVRAKAHRPPAAPFPPMSPFRTPTKKARRTAKSPESSIAPLSTGPKALPRPSVVSGPLLSLGTALNHSRLEPKWRRQNPEEASLSPSFFLTPSLPVPPHSIPKVMRVKPQDAPLRQPFEDASTCQAFKLSHQ